MVVLLTLTRHAQRRIVQAAAVAASDANAGSRILVVTAWSHSGGAGPRPAAASQAARLYAPCQITHAGLSRRYPDQGAARVCPTNSAAPPILGRVCGIRRFRLPLLIVEIAIPGMRS